MGVDGGGVWRSIWRCWMAGSDLRLLLLRRYTETALIRRWINSMSSVGVLIPDFDFFWKACRT